MPLLIALALIAAALAFALLSWPFALLVRYRRGTSRRRARPWVATLNNYALAVSTAIFMVSAAITSQWVPQAFNYAAIGLMAGCFLGLFGLWITRWEVAGDALFYKPNPLLVFAITLVVSARVAYGLWRAWQTWGLTPDPASWLTASGAAGSLGAGATVLGYYLIYWTGVRRRLTRLAG